MWLLQESICTLLGVSGSFPGHLPIFNKNLTLLHAGWTQRPSFTCAEAPKGLRELLMLLKMTTRSCASVPITMATECILCQVLGIKHPDNQTHQFPSPSFTHRYLGGWCLVNSRTISNHWLWRYIAYGCKQLTITGQDFILDNAGFLSYDIYWNCGSPLLQGMQTVNRNSNCTLEPIRNTKYQIITPTSPFQNVHFETFIMTSMNINVWGVQVWRPSQRRTLFSISTGL